MKHITLKTLFVFAALLSYGSFGYAGGSSSFGDSCTHGMRSTGQVRNMMRSHDTRLPQLNDLRFGLRLEMMANDCGVFNFKVDILDENGRVVRDFKDMSSRLIAASYAIVSLRVKVSYLTAEGELVRSEDRDVLSIGGNYFLTLEERAEIVGIEIDGFMPTYFF